MTTENVAASVAGFKLKVLDRDRNLFLNVKTANSTNIFIAKDVIDASLAGVFCRKVLSSKHAYM